MKLSNLRTLSIILITLLMSQLALADVIKLPPRLGKIIIKDKNTYKVKDIKSQKEYIIKEKDIITKKIDITKPILFKLPYRLLQPKEHYRFSSKQYKLLVKKHKQRVLNILTSFMSKAQEVNQPNYLPMDKYSFLNAFIKKAYASGDMDGICFFGGWPSAKAMNGKCNSPWRSTTKTQLNGTAFREMQQYDSSQFCNSSDHVRCNPMLFGEVATPQDYSAIESNQSDVMIKDSGALCVKKTDSDNKKFVNLTQKCKELSSALNLEVNINASQLQTYIDGALNYCQVSEISLTASIPDQLKDPCEPLIQQLYALKNDILSPTDEEQDRENDDEDDDDDDVRDEEDDRDDTGNNDNDNNGVPDKICIYDQANLINDIAPGEWDWQNGPLKICDNGQCYIEATCYYEKYDPTEEEIVVVNSLPTLGNSEVITNDERVEYEAFPTLLKCPCPESVTEEREDIRDANYSRYFGNHTSARIPNSSINQDYIDRCIEMTSFESERQSSEEGSNYRINTGGVIEN